MKVRISDEAYACVEDFKRISRLCIGKEFTDEDIDGDARTSLGLVYIRAKKNGPVYFDDGQKKTPFSEIIPGGCKIGDREIEISVGVNPESDAYKYFSLGPTQEEIIDKYIRTFHEAVTRLSGGERLVGKIMLGDKVYETDTFYRLGSLWVEYLNKLPA